MARPIAKPTWPRQIGGVVVSVIGLAFTVYAWTPPRIYDVTWFWVSLVAGAVSAGGMVYAGYTRAIGPRRARVDAAAGRRAGGSSAPSAPSRSARGRWGLLLRIGRGRGRDGNGKRAGVAPEGEPLVSPPALEEPGRAPAGTGSDGLSAGPARAPVVRDPAPATVAPSSSSSEATVAPAPPGAGVARAPEPAPPSAAPGPAPVRRVKVKCPRCSEPFTAQGGRPLHIVCPKCGLEGDIP